MKLQDLDHLHSNKHIRDKYNVVAVFDDRPQMVRLWNLMGLKTFACAGPYLEF